MMFNRGFWFRLGLRGHTNPVTPLRRNGTRTLFGVLLNK
jgi:hypothetical protein